MVASKEMNFSEFRKIFTEEFNFISAAFSRCQWPKPVESESESDENEKEVATTDEGDTNIDDSNNKIKSDFCKLKNLKDSQNRAGTIKELLQKHEEIRSKENRKRKKEEPKKSKHKNKKKKNKNLDENSTNSVKPSIKTEASSKSNGSKCDPSNIETKLIKGKETKGVVKNNLKMTRAPIKHGADVVVNEGASMLFSKLAFTNSVDELKPSIGGPKQPKHVLGKLEKMNSLISSLEERGKKEKAQRLKENMSWSNAFFKAEGAKVKDNTNQVMKSVKQLEKRKKTSERKWKKRLEEIKTKKETKDRKREAHIQKRVDQKKDRKLKKLIKRGRFIPELKTKPN